MKWLFIILAGILEIGWVISLKYTEGFTKLIPMIFYALFGFSSAFFFSRALQGISLALAYSIWTGIAVIGTAVAESYMTGKPMNLIHIMFMSLIIIGVMGLKLTNNSTP